MIIRYTHRNRGFVPACQGLQRQRGEGMLSFLIGMGLFIAMLPMAIQYMQRATDLDTAGAAAFHATQISEARDRYVKDNYSTILSNATSGPVSITTTMLKNAGYLDSGISDSNLNNQTYQTRAIRITAGGNELLRVLTVTSGGQPFNETEIRNIAAKTAKIGGGFVSSTNTAVAQGYQGSYQVALGDYGLAPGAGHVAVGGFFNTQGVLGDYLYRNAIPGHPELNQMNTNLSMGGNAINNVSTLSATGNITTAGDIQGHDLLATRNVAAAGEVTATTMTATGTIAGRDLLATRDLYADRNLHVAGNIATSGTVTASGNISAEGTVSGSYLWPKTDATEGTACSPNGLIAKTPAGLILSCQSGVWKKAQPAGRLVDMEPCETEPIGYDGRGRRLTNIPLPFPSGYTAISSFGNYRGKVLGVVKADHCDGNNFFCVGALWIRPGRGTNVLCGGNGN